MAFTTINAQATEVKLTIRNVSSHRLSAINVSLYPGEEKTVPLRYVSGDHFRAYDLYKMTLRRLIQVSLGNSGVLSANYLLSLQAPTAAPYGETVAMVGTDRPDPATVPVGFTVFNTTTSLLNVSDGTDYLDPTGAIVVWP